VIKAAIFLPLAFLSAVAFAQETYRCKIDGVMVIQDRPCPGAARRSESMLLKNGSVPASPPAAQSSTSPAETTQTKLERDKQYIDERVKARIYDREKTAAAEQIQHCDISVRTIENEINQVADGYHRGTPIDAANAQALQLDAQRRQVKVAALQSQAISRRSDCDRMRIEFDRTYRK
jgi:hypothetical protein